MRFPIGFTAGRSEEKPPAPARAAPRPAAARKSVVRVHFAGRGTTLSYFNDRFDLHPGDLVYVDGKLEGLLGRVTEVQYNFKIRLSDYRRVIARVDTAVRGHFLLAGSYLITFDRGALPAGQAVTWYRPPAGEDDEFVSGSDDAAFRLEDLGGMQVSAAIAERGRNYHAENRVQYLCLDGEAGYAIVEGGEAYEVEFQYRGGEIRRLTCTCFCSYPCKHEVAVMLQLRETLDWIAAHGADEYARAGYFAAVSKAALFSFAIDGRETGSLTL